MNSPQPADAVAPPRGWRTVPLEQYLLLAVGLFMAIRHQWISDDGYIYLTYVENLAVHGRGAVFNAGEFVEGCTSVAWLGLLSAARATAHAVAPDLLDGRQVALLVSHVLTLVTLSLIIRLNRAALWAHGVAPANRRGAADVNLPLIFVVGLAPFHHFFTSGLETPLVLLYLVGAALCVLGGGRSTLWLIALTAAGPLVRPDFGLVSAALCVYVWLRDGFWRAALVAALAALPNLAVEVGRIYYYAALLPNTYYVKTGLEGLWRHGLWYARDVMLAYGAQWLFVLAIAAAVVKFRIVGDRREWFGRAWLLATAAAYGAYVISVGGDFMHGRFWLPVLLLIALSFSGLGADIVSGAWPKAGPRLLIAGRLACNGLLLALLLVLQPIQTLIGDDRPYIYQGIDSELHRYLSQNANLHAWPGENQHRWARLGRAAGELATKLNSEIGVTSGGIGQLAYHGQLSGRVYVYDLLGLTRPTIARIDMGDIERRIGHKRLAPGLLPALHPRVDFHAPYFNGYAAAHGIAGLGIAAPLANLKLVPELLRQGLMTEAEAERMRAWRAAQLRGPIVDLNVALFLKARLPEEDPLHARACALLAEHGDQCAWARWLADHDITLASLAAQAGNAHDLAANWRIALRNHRLPPLPYLSDAPSFVVIEASSASHALLGPALWRWSDQPFADVGWEGGSLAVHIDGGKRHIYLTTGAEPFERALRDPLLALQANGAYLVQLAGEADPGVSASVFLMRYDEEGRRINTRREPFGGRLAVAIPALAQPGYFRLAVRVAGKGRLLLKDVQVCVAETQE